MSTAFVEDVPSIGHALSKGPHELLRGWAAAVPVFVEEGRDLLVVGSVVVSGEDPG